MVNLETGVLIAGGGALFTFGFLELKNQEKKMFDAFNKQNQKIDEFQKQIKQEFKQEFNRLADLISKTNK